MIKPCDRVSWLLPEAILPDPYTLQREVALHVQGSRIAAFCPAKDLSAEAEVLRFPGEVWVAAPILLHAHLESYDAPSSLWPRESFAEWVDYLLRWRAQEERLAPSESAWESLRELAATGCGLVVTHVAEYGADGRTMPATKLPPLFPEVYAFQELFAPDPSDQEIVLRQLDANPPSAHHGFALHAPYSVSEELARAVLARAKGWAVPVSIHLGEHAEEREFLRDGTGPLADLFRRRGRPLKNRPWASPVDWLQGVGGLGPGTFVVHGGDLDAEEVHRLQASGVQVVWCPGTHLYFDRPRPSFADDRVRLPALGCDSRASNARLDPLRELRLAFAFLPDPGPQKWWASLTQSGAAALQRSDLGQLQVGGRARILRIPMENPNSAENVCERLCADTNLRPRGPVWEPGVPFQAATET